MRGMYPSWMACSVMENAPEITACEAITVASVDNATKGINAQLGANR